MNTIEETVQEWKKIRASKVNDYKTYTRLLELGDEMADFLDTDIAPVFNTVGTILQQLSGVKSINDSVVVTIMDDNNG